MYISEFSSFLGNPVDQTWYSNSFYAKKVSQAHTINAHTKVIMQGVLIAVAYTLRTYWNQFSLGRICKYE